MSLLQARRPVPSELKRQFISSQHLSLNTLSRQPYDSGQTVDLNVQTTYLVLARGAARALPRHRWPLPLSTIHQRPPLRLSINTRLPDTIRMPGRRTVKGNPAASPRRPP